MDVSGRAAKFWDRCKLLKTIWRPVRESNPCRRRERAYQAFCTKLAQIALSSKTLILSATCASFALALVWTPSHRFVEQIVTTALPQFRMRSNARRHRSQENRTGHETYARMCDLTLCAAVEIRR